MSAQIILAVVAVALAGIAYLERKSLKTDVLAAEAKLEAKSAAFVAALRGKEGVIRTKIAADVAEVVSKAKAEAASLEAVIKGDVTKAEGSVKALLAKLEADLKKVV